MHDVIVVGAGLAGVSTGLQLLEKGYSVLILEALNVSVVFCLHGQTAVFPCVKTMSHPF